MIVLFGLGIQVVHMESTSSDLLPLNRLTTQRTDALLSFVQLLHPYGIYRRKSVTVDPSLPIRPRQGSVVVDANAAFHLPESGDRHERR